MSSAPYSRQFTIQVTDQTLQFIDALALRQHTSRSEIVRQAIREYLDVQENVIGSRSSVRQHRMAAVGGGMRNQLVRPVNRTSTLLLAAVILQQIEHGELGTRVMAQITRLADQIEEHLPREASETPAQLRYARWQVHYEQHDDGRHIRDGSPSASRS